MPGKKKKCMIHEFIHHKYFLKIFLENNKITERASGLRSNNLFCYIWPNKENVTLTLNHTNLNITLNHLINRPEHCWSSPWFRHIFCNGCFFSISTAFFSRSNLALNVRTVLSFKKGYLVLK